MRKPQYYRGDENEEVYHAVVYSRRFGAYRCSSNVRVFGAGRFGLFNINNPRGLGRELDRRH
jgi:hypothetical protein